MPAHPWETQRLALCRQAFNKAIDALEKEYGELHVRRAAAERWGVASIQNAEEDWDTEYDK